MRIMYALLGNSPWEMAGLLGNDRFKPCLHLRKKFRMLRVFLFLKALFTSSVKNFVRRAFFCFFDFRWKFFIVR